ncbi:MAG: glycosyltransferase [Pseudomonadota bacterium]
MTSFSLALCTYNRSSLLREALNSLALCLSPVSDWELLLIDNNSSDDTRVVAEFFQGLLPLRYIFEPNQGLSFARNRALRECRSDVLLFTDDDLRFDREWLVSYERAFSAEQESGWFGGRVLPLWKDEPPSWLRDESMPLIAGLLVRYDLGGQDRHYQHVDPAPFGASFALRRQAFEKAGPFRIDLGVRGRVPGRGEDAEYIERLRQADIPGFYVGAAIAWHTQDPTRFGWRYLYRYGAQKGITAARMAISGNRVGGTWACELEYGLKGILQLLKGRGDHARQCVVNMGIQRGLRKSRIR